LIQRVSTILPSGKLWKGRRHNSCFAKKIEVTARGEALMKNLSVRDGPQSDLDHGSRNSETKGEGMRKTSRGSEKGGKAERRADQS